MMNSRKYLLEFGAAMAIYVIVLLYSLSYLRSHPETEYKLVLAFAPVIPIFLITWAVLFELDRLDEMQKRIQHNAMAVSFGAGTLFLLTEGFLHHVGVDLVDSFWVGIGMLSLWGTISMIQSIRYGRGLG